MNYSKTVRVEVIGLKEALRDVSIYDNKVWQGVGNSIKTGGRNVARLARTKAPVRTGKLKKSIKSSYKSNKTTVESVVKSSARYAHLVEFGAKGVTIKPKNKKALAIKGGAEPFYSAKVKIPARKAKPFMRPSYEQEKPHIEKAIAQALKRS